jgi:hypothetical protein
MPSDIRIQSVPPLSSVNEAVVEPKAASYPLSAATDLSTAPAMANPSLRLDPSLGLVVLEFHSGSGAVTTSIPSQHQLEAYQRWTQTGIGTPPGSMAGSVTTGNRQAPPAQLIEPAPQASPPPQGRDEPASGQDP